MNCCPRPRFVGGAGALGTSRRLLAAPVVVLQEPPALSVTHWLHQRCCAGARVPPVAYWLRFVTTAMRDCGSFAPAAASFLRLRSVSSPPGVPSRLRRPFGPRSRSCSSLLWSFARV